MGNARSQQLQMQPRRKLETRRSFANPTRTSKNWSNKVNVFIVVYDQRLDVNMWMFTFTVYVHVLNVRGRTQSLFTATFWMYVNVNIHILHPLIARM